MASCTVFSAALTDCAKFMPIPFPFLQFVEEQGSTSLFKLRLGQAWATQEGDSSHLEGDLSHVSPAAADMTEEGGNFHPTSECGTMAQLV
jgi:hypothetical protein